MKQLLVTLDGKIRIKLTDIKYVEDCKKNLKLILYLEDNSKPIELQLAMDGIELELCSKGFCRIHKNYIVNFLYLKRINSDKLMLTDGTELPIDKKKYSKIMLEYLKYGKVNNL